MLNRQPFRLDNITLASFQFSKQVNVPNKMFSYHQLPLCSNETRKLAFNELSSQGLRPQEVHQQKRAQTQREEPTTYTATAALIWNEHTS